MSTNHQAAGLVVFRLNSAGARLYLLIRHSAGHWEIPKGHLEHNETWQQTALREVEEETGIANPRVVKGFARQIQYVYRDRKNRLILKTVRFGLAQTELESIKLSQEHSDFAFLDYTSAMARLTHAGTRAVLRDAHAFKS